MWSKMFTKIQVRTGMVVGLIACLMMGAAQASAAPPYNSAPMNFATPRARCGYKPIRSVRTTQKVVAMTFDDGPWPTNTDAVMNHLANYGAKGSFFMVSNNALKYPTIAKRVLLRGHEIANHAKTHASYSPSVIATEFSQANQDFFKIMGIFPWVVRPPGLTKGAAIDNYVSSRGVCNVHTDNDLGDWRSPRVSSATLCARFKQQLHPGYIALLHDGGSHTQTVNAVPCMLSYAKSQGYKFLTITQILNTGTHVN